jgi:hypothetical protein
LLPGGKRFPWTGDLEEVFNHEENTFHVGLIDVLDLDFTPSYKNGKLVRLVANKVGDWTWRKIETSPQARDLSDLAFELPNLNQQTWDDCVAALRGSPLVPGLRVLQLGRMARGWNECHHEDAGEIERTDALVNLLENALWVDELYLALSDVSDRLLCAQFGKTLKVLQMSAYGHINMGALTENDSLTNVNTLILHQSWRRNAGTDRDEFAALVNSANLDNVQDLHIAMEQLDDACCEVLTTSRKLPHLSRLWLHGDGITDIGAVTLVSCPHMQSLRELHVDGSRLMEKGHEAIRAAGLKFAIDVV